MEIDVREDSGGKPDVIRFANDLVLSDLDNHSCAILFEDDDGYERDIEIDMTEVSNLIKALKKYQELYG